MKKSSTDRVGRDSTTTSRCFRWLALCSGRPPAQTPTRCPSSTVPVRTAVSTGAGLAGATRPAPPRHSRREAPRLGVGKKDTSRHDRPGSGPVSAIVLARPRGGVHVLEPARSSREGAAAIRRLASALRCSSVLPTYPARPRRTRDRGVATMASGRSANPMLAGLALLIGSLSRASWTQSTWRGAGRCFVWPGKAIVAVRIRAAGNQLEQARNRTDDVRFTGCAPPSHPKFASASSPRTCARRRRSWWHPRQGIASVAQPSMASRSSSRARRFCSMSLTFANPCGRVLPDLGARGLRSRARRSRRSVPGRPGRWRRRDSLR